MVRATVNEEDLVKHDLKTLPGGWVQLKRLSYGQKLHRRAMVSKMQFQAGGKGKTDFQGEMQLINETATQFDFAHCIVDHNLEDETGQKLDLSKPSDIRRLDPRVGEEIDSLLDDLNNFEDADEEGKL